MRFWPTIAIVALPAMAVAQALPMTREGVDSALAQYFAGADRNGDGRLDRAETAEALGFARSMLSAKRDEAPFALDIAPDGSPRLSLNNKGPLGRSGMIDMLFHRTDRDGDDMLSLAEVQAAGRERFDAVDRNHDGILDERERQAARQQFALLRRMLSGN